MSNVVDTLVEMGFTKERAELAIKRSGSSTVETAMEWLLAHEGEVDEAPSTTSGTADSAGAEEPNQSQPQSDPPASSAEEPPAPAKSIVCDDCGKLFNNTVEVEVHATKTGHENFSESTEEKKPLTDEEKKEQLAKIEAKLKQRRMEREAREKEEAILREKNRIKSGKDMIEAKKKHEELEMKKIVEERKREKEEERLARERVKRQIEQDKQARKAKFGGAQEEPASPPQPVLVNRAAVNYDQVKLQIRLTNGSTLQQTFGAKEPLSAVRLYVEMNRTDADAMTPSPKVNLMVSFPRMVFKDEDYDKPLDTLGLAPSAVLIVSKT